MAIPDYETLMLPVLKLTAQGIDRVPQMLPHLQTQFGLSDEEMSELLPSGRTALIASRAHWARTYLVKAGVLARSGRGVCVVTERGRAILAERPDAISNELLSRFEEFNEWRSASAAPRDDAAARISDGTAGSARSPEENIEAAFAEIEAGLLDEVLARVIDASPQFFERLIVDLLLAMGYGRGMARAGRAIGRSGDGGIDGVINEDALGLDAVYIQAKRYALDSKVGRPAIQQFVGSLTGESATKGVFVSTSDFSAEARAYVDRVQQRIVLINGAQLARLMIGHGVGVRTRQTYALRSVDEDYFSDV